MLVRQMATNQKSINVLGSRVGPVEKRLTGE